MTQQDLYLVIGIVLLGLSIPSALGAWADRRPPRVAAIVIVIGGSLMALAFSQTPGGYDFHGIANAFVQVVAHYTR